MKLNYNKLIFAFILITPLFPKLKIFEGVYIYMLELILISLVPLFLINYRRTFNSVLSLCLFSFWLVLLVITLVSFLFQFEFIGILKILKYILYIPIIATGYYLITNWRLKILIYVGLLAAIINLIIYYIYYFL